MITRFTSLVRALFGRRRFEDGMAEEMRFHLAQYAEDLVRARRIASAGAHGVRQCRRGQG
jgi:hypothetical protein